MQRRHFLLLSCHSVSCWRQPASREDVSRVLSSSLARRPCLLWLRRRGWITITRANFHATHGGNRRQITLKWARREKEKKREKVTSLTLALFLALYLHGCWLVAGNWLSHFYWCYLIHLLSHRSKVKRRRRRRWRWSNINYSICQEERKVLESQVIINLITHEVNDEVRSLISNFHGKHSPRLHCDCERATRREKNEKNMHWDWERKKRRTFLYSMRLKIYSSHLSWFVKCMQG